MSQLVAWLTLVLAVCAGSSTASASPRRVIVSKSATYSNLAWGFSDGGRDTNTGQSVVLLDLDATSNLASLKAQGHIVQCYFSVGTAEVWRPDYNRTAWIGLALGALPQFSDEYWLDLYQIDKIKTIMTPRFQRAKQLGCDAIEPDNTDCHNNNECSQPLLNAHPGANVRQLQINYCKWQTEIAHSLGMSISLKNSLDIIPDLVNFYDFAVNEQCHQFNECNAYMPFLNQNKAVFNHEYQLGSGTNYCTSSANLGIKTKRCNGSPSNGLCGSNPWQNCYAPLNPLPAITYTQGNGTFAPTTLRPTSRRPTNSPVTKRPTTGYPTRRRRTSFPTRAG